MLKKSDTKSVTEIVEEKLSQKRLQEKMATGGMPYPHYTSTPPKKLRRHWLFPSKQSVWTLKPLQRLYQLSVSLKVMIVWCLKRQMSHVQDAMTMVITLKNQ